MADAAAASGAGLCHSTECLTALFALLQDGVALVEDSTGQFVDFNAVLPRDLGYAPDELARLSLFDLCPDESVAPVRQRLAALGSHATAVADVQQRRKDGRHRMARLHVRRLPSPQECLLLVLCRDTTPHERKLADARENEEMLRLALEAVSDGLWDWHLPSATFTRSAAWLALTGYTAEELERRERVHGTIIHPDDAVAVDAAFARHLDGRSPAYQAEFRIRHKSGEWRWLLGRGRVVQRDLNGMPVRVMGTDTDITVRKNMEQRLRQSQRMETVGQLAGGVAHDFNNVLTAVLGNAEMLRLALNAQLPAGDPLLECVEQIEQAGQRAATLTRQLLAFSRRQALDLQLIDVNVILGDTEKLLCRLVPEHIELHVTCAAALWPVRADPGQIEQLLVNLLVHARDRMPDGGLLEIATENVELPDADDPRGRERFVRIRIRDTGPAPTPATIARALDPLRSLDAGGVTSSLGLATVRGIVAQARGQVTAERPPDGGAVLNVLLPAQAEAIAAAPQPAPGTEQLRGTETILVCEDDPAVRQLTCRTLEANGYPVLCADSGPHALQICERHGGRVDILLADVILPGMTGRALAERLIERQPDLRVLYVSGYPQDMLSACGVPHPGADLIRKPFTSRELLLRLRRALDNPPQSPA